MEKKPRVTPLIPLDDNEVTEQQRMCSAHSHIKATCSEPVLRVKRARSALESSYHTREQRMRAYNLQGSLC